MGELNMNTTVKFLNTIFAGIITLFYGIWALVLPYTAENNPDTTLASLQAQALGVPFAGILFEPLVLFFMMLCVWIFSLIFALSKDQRQIKSGGF